MGRASTAKKGRQQQSKRHRDFELRWKPAPAPAAAAKTVRGHTAEVEEWYVELVNVTLRIGRDKLRQRELVVLLRDCGMPWAAIADCLGVSKASAHERFRRFTDSGRVVPAVVAT